jgi:hypothetical protein
MFHAMWFGEVTIRPSTREKRRKNLKYEYIFHGIAAGRAHRGGKTREGRLAGSVTRLSKAQTVHLRGSKNRTYTSTTIREIFLQLGGNRCSAGSTPSHLKSLV